MAVLITSQAIVKTVNPKSMQFTINELNSLVEGWIEPVKIGPLWIMYKEGSKSEPVNEIASIVFNVPLRGTVLVVPVQQLPSEWDLMEPEDYKYGAEEVDLGFLVSLQNVLMLIKIGGHPSAAYSPDGSVVFNIGADIKEEWLYDPSNPKSEEAEETKSFFNKVYPFVVKETEKLKEKILFEETGLIIKVESIEDLKTTIQQMIDVYVEEEEYEKCATLQKVANELENC